MISGNKFIIKPAAFCLVLMMSLSVCAADEAEARIAALLKGKFPDLKITRIAPAPVPGMYEVLIGTDVIYVTADGRYLIQGDLLDLTERRNVTEQQRAGLRVKKLSEVPVADMIEFASATPKHIVYVFTDVECGYCRRLHRDMPEINKRGISVRYLAFPRAGVGSSAFLQMESVWCAADRRKALTAAKSGMPVTSKSCANPVATQYALGEALGVRGTPAIYATDGRALPGYMPPDALLNALEEKQQY